MGIVMSKNIHVNILEEHKFDVDVQALTLAVLNGIEEIVHTTPPEKPFELSLKFSDDNTVKELNKTFRGKDKPTNVLSFPGDEEMPGTETTTTYIGDIIFAKETVAKEALAQNKKFADHLSHLIIHGILHLYGYDHVEDAEAEEMEALEVSILVQLNIANPYKEI